MKNRLLKVLLISTVIVGVIISGNSNLLGNSYRDCVYASQGVIIKTQPKDQSGKVGSNVTFSLVTENAVSYQWQYRKTGSSEWKNWSGATGASVSGTVQKDWSGMSVRCVVKGKDGANVISSEVKFTESTATAAVIKTQPKDQSGKVGSNVTFSLAAENAVSYQWQYRKTGSSEWKNWSGATGASITGTVQKDWSGMSVRCVVKGKDGANVISSEVKFTESTATAAVIKTQPKDQSGKVGSNVTFSLAAENAVSYQWQYRKTGSSEWKNWSGATGASVSGTVQKDWSGMSVRCVVKGKDGANVISSEVKFTESTATVIKTQPKDQSGKVGSNVTFSLAAENAVSYQWQYRKTGSSEWKNWSGATGASITGTVQKDWSGMSVRCVVKGKDGANVISSEVKFTESTATAAVIKTQPKDQSGKVGSNVTFSLAAENAVSYQWQYRKTGSSEWKNWSGATGASITGTVQTDWSGMSVRCVVKGKDGAAVISNEVKFTESTATAAVIKTQPKSQSGKVGSKVTFSLAAENAASYQWQYKKTGSSEWKNWSGATGASITGTVQTDWSGMSVRCVVKGKDGAAVMSDEVKFTESTATAAVIKTQPKSQSGKVGSKVTFSLAAENAASYQWQYKKTGSSEWKNWSGATGASITGTVQTDWSGMSVRCVVKGKDGAAVISDEVRFTEVAASAVIKTQPKSQSGKVGSKVTFSLAAENAASYQWQYKKTGSSEWKNWSGATGASITGTVHTDWSGMSVRCVVKGKDGVAVISDSVLFKIIFSEDWELPIM